jgi:hypothetical protein
VNTAPVRTDTLVGSLSSIREAKLHNMPAIPVATIVRRIVDNQALVPALDIAAFNSAV